MKAYRKLIVAVAGVAAMLANRYYGIDPDVLEPALVDATIGALTAAGVWRVKNDPS